MSRNRKFEDLQPKIRRATEGALHMMYRAIFEWMKRKGMMNPDGTIKPEYLPKERKYNGDDQTNFPQ